MLFLCLTSVALAVPAVNSVVARKGCSGHGALNARLNGAINRDLEWSDADMNCAGSVRPDESGLRLTAQGPLPGRDRSLRILLGIAGARPGMDGRNLAANLTLIIGSPGKIYATRGDDKCTVDTLKQQALPATAPDRPRWRVHARGFCIAPAATLDGRSRILLSRFDLQTELTLGD